MRLAPHVSVSSKIAGPLAAGHYIFFSLMIFIHFFLEKSLFLSILIIHLTDVVLNLRCNYRSRLRRIGLRIDICIHNKVITEKLGLSRCVFVPN